MGSFENLDTEEPLGPRMERHAFDRLIMLSDGVFAIAITLAALELRPPDHWEGLAGLWASLKFSLAAYAISFGVIAAYWTSQRDLMSRMRKVDNLFTALCLVQLFFVALIPTATKLLYVNGTTGSAVQGYSVVLAACGFLASAMWSYGSFKPGLMLKENQDNWMRWMRLVTALIVPVFFTIILLTGGRSIMLMLYVTGAFVVLRRGVLPWLQHRRAAKITA
jgi:uncharacterized membrane protein